VTAELALCPHLARAAPGEPPFETSLVLDAHGAATDAVVRCRHCAGTALLRLLDWAGPDLRLRVYSLAPVAEAHAALLRRDLARGSCDLARPGRELEAFLACAGPVERILALDVHENRLLASAAPPAGCRVPVRSWRAGLPEASDAAWFEPLGLAKAGAEGAREAGTAGA
jgi:hypothetical protein